MLSLDIIDFNVKDEKIYYGSTCLWYLVEAHSHRPVIKIKIIAREAKISRIYGLLIM